MDKMQEALEELAPVGAEASTEVRLEGFVNSPAGWELREFNLTLKVEPLPDRQGIEVCLCDDGTNDIAAAAASRRWFAEHTDARFYGSGRGWLSGIIGANHAPPITLLEIVDKTLTSPCHWLVGDQDGVSTVWTNVEKETAG